jgi:Flp pilus assembly protein TadD
MAHNNLGAAMMRQGRIPEAVQHFRKALRIKPEDEQTRRYLQLAIAQLGDESTSTAPAAIP